ncbi:VOC family protein [Roseomonas sp. GC11]|uniref:VOC family protein n=1 Tax=Roseomonas sp. GC11 TaxID=2950546 RepID=UPI00210B9655|nr:VOC family protein [Roseomonas sp. GC11]MCQ4161401.1 VOC family protein [Roseomonas sp. GC11]
MTELLSPADDAPAAEAPWNAALHPAEVTLAARDAAGLAQFYHRLLGLPVVAEEGGFRLGRLLRLRAAPEAAPEPGGVPGLYHTAFLLPSRAALAGWLHHAAALGLRLQGASDHGVSEAIYLADPEGNGIEVYRDRARAAWPRPYPGAPGVAMGTRRLDLRALLEEVAGPVVPASVGIGHVHLRGGDVAATSAFYQRLGLEEMQGWPQASFLGHAGYHHHLAVNGWDSAGQRPAGLTGLARLTLAARDEATFRRAAAALQGAVETPEGLLAHDPSGNPLLLARGGVAAG